MAQNLKVTEIFIVLTEPHYYAPLSQYNKLRWLAVVSTFVLSLGLENFPAKCFWAKVYLFLHSPPSSTVQFLFSCTLSCAPHEKSLSLIAEKSLSL